MKPIVIHDGFNPTRFFLYLFPEEPKFDPKEVGEPAFLTPYLEKGQNEEARKRAQVVLQDWPKMESYAGFLNVNPEYNSNLYFWFFPSQSKPSSDPVILWLQVCYDKNNNNSKILKFSSQFAVSKIANWEDLL